MQPDIPIFRRCYNMSHLEIIDFEEKYKVVFYDKISKPCSKAVHQDFFMKQRISFHQDFILRGNTGIRVLLIFVINRFNKIF